jgi:N-acyl homoserine lactone hydrolase
MLRIEDVVRVPLGRFIRPPEETGTGQPRVEPVLGYVVRHDAGAIMLDTGIGATDAETEEWYRPDRIPLPEALRRKGFALDDITTVVNCHLHFDHCGGNPLLAGTPIVVQRRELRAAQDPDYTIPELVDHDGVRYEEVDGEVELRPGVLVVPTPGHTAGHQSVVVRCADGTVVLAGQSHDHTSDFAADALAVQAQRDGLPQPLPLPPPWMERLLDLDPRRVLFAHDGSVWAPVAN